MKSWVENFHLDPRIIPIDLGWNLGLTQKIPTHTKEYRVTLFISSYVNFIQTRIQELIVQLQQNIWQIPMDKDINIRTFEYIF